MWCVKETTRIDVKSSEKPKGQKRRCPKCGKYMLVRIFESNDPGCWHIWFPAHKVPKAKRKRKKFKELESEKK